MHNWIYISAIIVLCTGLFIMLTSDNYIRKIMGLGVFQSSVLIFYIALGKVKGGILPIDICANTAFCPYQFSSPLPHILMLTAIVVGFATMAVGLALTLQIKRTYNTASESEINQIYNGE
ncbi:MAG: cation:proton antiporter [Rickettsiales bacterium]|nr:MAG: cation:proton antiporter [Rickettsiales bacterium]